MARKTWTGTLSTPLDVDAMNDLEGRKLETDQVGVAGGVAAVDSLALNVKDFGALGNGVADDMPAIQAALDAAKAAGGGHVYVPDGTYLLSSMTTGGNGLMIWSNTKLELSKGATIKRNSAGDSMIRVGGTPGDVTVTLYGGQSNIEIFGGTWDCNKTGFPSNCNIITSGHAQYVYVHDTVLCNWFGWHALEFNSSQHCVARNITFRDFDSTTTNKEMLQIDRSSGSGTGALANWQGANDDTPCNDILVDGCTFVNGCRGVGSHSAAAGKPHNLLRVTNCHFSGLREAGVEAYAWQNVTIANNTFDNCQSMIHIFEDTDTLNGFSVTGNVGDNFPSTGTFATLANTWGIKIHGSSAATRKIRNVSVMGNVVRNVLKGHGIDLDYLTSVIANNNVVSGCGLDGLQFYQCQKGQCAGNNCHGNGTDHTFSTVGDIALSGNGLANTLQDVVAVGNSCDLLYVGPGGDRLIVSQNVIGTYTLDATPPTNVQKASNFIAGTWTA